MTQISRNNMITFQRFKISVIFQHYLRHGIQLPDFPHLSLPLSLLTSHFSSLLLIFLRLFSSFFTFPHLLSLISSCFPTLAHISPSLTYGLSFHLLSSLLLTFAYMFLPFLIFTHIFRHLSSLFFTFSRFLYTFSHFYFFTGIYVYVPEGAAGTGNSLRTRTLKRTSYLSQYR